jgi:hypothetical protein
MPSSRATSPDPVVTQIGGSSGENGEKLAKASRRWTTQVWAPSIGSITP